ENPLAQNHFLPLPMTDKSGQASFEGRKQNPQLPFVSIGIKFSPQSTDPGGSAVYHLLIV
ncbi:MAG: hypothetical protein ABW109_22045, partial [Candidatus Thiodiazotropha sp. 6PLUC4]